MIVTRSWLEEFVDLDGIDNEKLSETFNAIGLEVDSIEEMHIPEKVVIGKIVSCEKHPDADKLNVCQVDIGTGVRQIVCGAANVVDAEYVAVATIGAVLPGNFEIKHAVLRGVESDGMICAASEIGLPDLGKGIMILDESIGELKVGKALAEYEKVADTVIELELTANRGDCLSIYGVARDLSAALGRELKAFEYKQQERMKLGIARKAELHSRGETDADLRYKLARIREIDDVFLIRLRLGFVGAEAQTPIEKTVAYAVHATGVILRFYDTKPYVEEEEERIIVSVERHRKGIVHVHINGKHAGIVGVNQTSESKVRALGGEIFIEASYIPPDILSEAVSEEDKASFETDELYYRTSRGSNPDLTFGLRYLASLLDRYSDIECYEGMLEVHNDREPVKLSVSVSEISTIVGMEIELSKIVAVLQKLGFEIQKIGEDQLSVSVPSFRHDISNIQDITEEIVRMIGINNIPAKALCFTEKNRINDAWKRHQAKKALRQRAVSAGFFENVSYLFSQRDMLERYGFETLKSNEDLANPIAEELNTLRTTLLINALQAVKRNVNYSKRTIPLFEIGAVYDAKRRQSTKVAFVFSGQKELASVPNAGKPDPIDFFTFVSKLESVVGAVRLEPCTETNALLHPYQSADVFVDGRHCGYLSKLHPNVQADFDIPDTYIAELNFDVLMPDHKNATAISNYQGVYKDLSVVVDKSIHFKAIADALRDIEVENLRDVFPIDVYTDESLGDKKSVTIRLFIQSFDKTLEEADIEEAVATVLEKLKYKTGAELR